MFTLDETKTSIQTLPEVTSCPGFSRGVRQPERTKIFPKNCMKAKNIGQRVARVKYFNYVDSPLVTVALRYRFLTKDWDGQYGHPFCVDVFILLSHRNRVKFPLAVTDPDFLDGGTNPWVWGEYIMFGKTSWKWKNFTEDGQVSLLPLRPANEWLLLTLTGICICVGIGQCEWTISRHSYQSRSWFRPVWLHHIDKE